MNQIVFSWFVAMAAVMTFPPLANAQLFGRRGCSTGHCFAPVVHHAAPVIEKRDILQNFFIGLSPTPLDSPQGTTRYFRDLASEVVLASDKDYIEFGKLLANGGIDAMATARSIRPGLEAIANKNAEANLTLAKGEAVATAFRSISSDTSGTAKTVVMTLRNGKLEQFQELSATPADAPADMIGGNRFRDSVEPQAAPVPREIEPAELDHFARASDLFNAKCATCHSAAGKAKNPAYKDLRELDGEIDDDDLKAALARINSKDKKLRMPKGGDALTAAEKEPLYTELLERMK